LISKTSAGDDGAIFIALVLDFQECISLEPHRALFTQWAHDKTVHLLRVSKTIDGVLLSLVVGVFARIVQIPPS